MNKELGDVKSVVKVAGFNEDIFRIMNRVILVLKRAGADIEVINKYQEEALCADYNEFIEITKTYVEVE